LNINKKEETKMMRYKRKYLRWLILLVVFLLIYPGNLDAKKKGRKAALPGTFSMNQILFSLNSSRLPSHFAFPLTGISRTQRI
jgi:hypothetical protein